MKSFDEVLVWAIIIALAAVIVASDQTTVFLEAVAKLLQSLIGVITSPQTGGTK